MLTEFGVTIDGTTSYRTAIRAIQRREETVGVICSCISLVISIHSRASPFHCKHQLLWESSAPARED